MKFRYTTVFILLSCTILNSQQEKISPERVFNLLTGMWYEVALSPPEIRGDCRCNTFDFEYIHGRTYLQATFRCIIFRNQKSRIQVNQFKLYPSGLTGEVLRSGGVSGEKYQLVTLNGDLNIIVIYNTHRQYIHLLSRDAYIPAYKFDEVVKLLNNKGYNTTRLKKTMQNCDLIE